MQDITGHNYSLKAIAPKAIAPKAIAPKAIDVMEIVPKSRDSGNFETYKKR